MNATSHHRSSRRRGPRRPRPHRCGGKAAARRQERRAGRFRRAAVRARRAGGSGRLRRRRARGACARAPGRSSPRASRARRKSASSRRTRRAGDHLKSISVIEIVNDDMPFLVDSVMAELDRARPRRPPGRASDPRGRARQGRQAQSAPPARRAAGQGEPRESFIHIHVERIDDAARRAEIVQALEQVLAEVRRLRAGLAADAPARRRGDRRSSRPIRRRCRSTTSPRRSSSSNGWRPTTSPCSACATTPSPDKSRDLAPVHGHRARPAARRRRAGAHARRQGGDDHAAASRVLRRAEDADRHQGQRQVARAPPRLSRLHRRQALRRRRQPVGEFRIVGLFTSTAYTRSIRSIPYLRRKVDAVLTRAGFDPESHSGKALVNVLETYPRDELFQIDEDTLYHFALSDPAARGAPARARAGAARPLRPLRLGAGLCAARALRAAGARADRRLSRRGLQGPRQRLLSVHSRKRRSTRVHFIIGRKDGATPDPDRATLEQAVGAIVRTWTDALGRGACRGPRAGPGPRAVRALSATAFSDGYREAYSPAGRGRRHPRHRERCRRSARSASTSIRAARTASRASA